MVDMGQWIGMGFVAGVCAARVGCGAGAERRSSVLLPAADGGGGAGLPATVRLNRAVARGEGETDGARVAVYLTETVGRLVAAVGPGAAAAYLRSHRSEFRSDAGDYVFLYARDAGAGGGFRYVFHDDPDFDGRDAAAAEAAIGRMCVEGRDRGLLGRVLAAGAAVADARPEGGFVAYRWFSPRTHDLITKRTYVRRVADGLYAASGSAVPRGAGDADAAGVLVVLASFALLNCWWGGLGVSRLLDGTPVGAAAVYAAACALFAAMAWGTCAEDDVHPYDAEVQMGRHVDTAALGLAGLAFSLARFASTSPLDAPRALVAVSFLLLLPTLLQCRSCMSARSVRRRTQMKNALVANCACALAVAAVLVGF